MSFRVVAAIVAVVGVVAVLLTLSLEYSRTAYSMGYSGLTVVSMIAFPGLMGSMVIAGNVHAFSLWVAAFLNGLFYCGLSWAACALLNSIVRRVR